MKKGSSWIGLVALVCVAHPGCDESSPRAGAGSEKSAAASASPEPPTGEGKKLITITTRSPEAKAAFRKGWGLWDSGRNPEALAECERALALDAHFALAQACVGTLTPGAAGQAYLDTAVAIAAKLPEAEKSLIDGLAAMSRGDTAAYDRDMKKLAQAAPDDYSAHLWAARPALLRHDFPEAEAEYKVALALKPTASAVYASLAQVQAQQQRYGDALASAKRFVEGSPSEPAAQRVLGSALLNLNKVTEAEAAFAQAVELGPTVLGAYYELAEARTMLGNFAGARDALAQGKVADASPGDAIDRRTEMAWVSFAEGQEADALAILDAAEKDAETQNLPNAWHPARVRAGALWILGNAAGSLKAAQAALAKCDARAQSSSLEKAQCHLGFVRAEAFAQLSLGRLAEAQRTVAQLQGEVKKVPGRAQEQLDVEMLFDAVTALDKKDATVRAALLAKCPPDADSWRLAILRMAAKAGDPAMVDQVRRDLASRPRLDFAYPLIVKVMNE